MTTPSPVRKHSWFITRKIVLLSLGIVFLWFIVILGPLRIFLPTYPWISGFPFWSKTYLILLQNDAELRPGGGFISGLGTLRFVGGIPVEFSIQDAYTLPSAVSDEEMPYPMREFLESPYFRGWTFQDSNVYSDFSANAKKAIEIYDATIPGQNIAGVISVNFSFIEELVGVLGGVRVGQEVWMEDTLFPLLEYRVNNVDRHDVAQLKSRKDVLSPLMTSMLRGVLFSPSRYPYITKAIVRALDTKDIQLFFTSATVQNHIRERGWTSETKSPDRGDFLAVVESNLAGMKSDRFLSRRIEYTVDLGRLVEGAALRPRATVRIHLAHHGDYNEPLSFTYKGFMKVLVPPGSTLISADKETPISGEGGYESFGKKVLLEPGQRATIEFSYFLPDIVVRDWGYHLHLHKQSGTNDSYDVTVRADGDTILSGEHWETSANVAIFRDVLATNRDIALTVTPDHIPPRVTIQVFTTLNTIELHTNEPLDERFCESPSNYSLRDMNKNHSEQTDAPRILSVQCQERGIILRVDGVTKQPEEFYQLTIQSIRDLSGNELEYIPRTYTIVQRL